LVLKESWERAFKFAIKLWFRERHVAEFQVCTSRLDTPGRREATGSQRGLARSVPKHLDSISKRTAGFSSRHQGNDRVFGQVFWVDRQKKT
jgi:hypothetical protein